MARRAIGLELVNGELRAVQLVRHGRALTVERMVRVAIPKEGLSGKELRALISRERLKTDAQVVLGVGLGEVTFAHFDTELTHVDHVRAVARYELEHDLPQSADDLATDAIGPLATRPDGRGRFLIAAASQPSLDARIMAVTNAGLLCELVETEAGALHALAQVCDPGLGHGRYAVIHQTDTGWLLIVGLDGRLAAARSLSWLPGQEHEGDVEDALARELDLSWRQVFEEPCAAGPKVKLSCPDSGLGAAIAKELERRFSVVVETLDPSARFSVQERTFDPALTLMLGLGLRGVGEGGSGMNLYVTRTLPVRLIGEIRRQLSVAMVLGGLIGGLACATVQLELHRLESARAEQKQAANAAFLAAVPNEQPIKPLPQLQAKLQTLTEDLERLGDRVDAAKTNPLVLLRLLSAHASAGALVAVTGLEINGASGTFDAVSESEDSMEQFRAELAAEPELSSVKIDASGEEGDLGVWFTMVLELGSGATDLLPPKIVARRDDFGSSRSNAGLAGSASAREEAK